MVGGFGESPVFLEGVGVIVSFVEVDSSINKILRGCRIGISLVWLSEG